MIRSRSPEMSPDMKKAKLDVFPDHKKATKPKLIDKEEVAEYLTALREFKEPNEEELNKTDWQKFRQYPGDHIENYFYASARWGVPAISWDIVRPVFLWKLNFTIKEFQLVEKRIAESKKDSEMAFEVAEKVPEAPKEKLSIMGNKVNLIKTTPVVFNLEEAIEFVLNKANNFDGFPFTWQRLCELLSNPMHHYNRIEKYVRALDKVINVVTTITEWGDRVNGEWEIPVDPTVQHIENVFFGPVDEVEAMDNANKKQEEDEKPLDMTKKIAEENVKTEEEESVEMKEEKEEIAKEETVEEKEVKKKVEDVVDSSEQEKMEVEPDMPLDSLSQSEAVAEVKPEEPAENVQ